MGVFGNPPLGSVKIEGRNIDFVEIYRSFANPRGQPECPGHIVYEYSYVVRKDVRRQDDFKAHSELVKTGIISKKIVGFTWKGGTFANNLNADEDLKTKVLEIGAPTLLVNANQKNGYVSISAAVGRTGAISIDGVLAKYDLIVGRKAFPSREAFGVYDRIAVHVRNVT